MADISEVYVAQEATVEIEGLPKQGQVRVHAEMLKLKSFGWVSSLQIQVLRKLSDTIFELRVLGHGPAYRLLCFPHGGKLGRVAVVVLCGEKPLFLGHRRMKAMLKRADRRREAWIQKYGGKV